MIKLSYRRKVDVSDIESAIAEITKVSELNTPAPTVSDKNGSDLGKKLRYATDKLDQFTFDGSGKLLCVLA